MKTDYAPQPDQLLDLLVDRALEGLSHDDEVRLQGLLATGRVTDEDEMDRVVATLDAEVAAMEFEPMPAGLCEQLRMQGEHWLEQRRRSNGHHTATGRSVSQDQRNGLAGRIDLATKTTPSRFSPPAPSAVMSSRSPWLRWVAAAACLVLTVIIIFPLLNRSETTPDARRQALLADASDVIRVMWTRTDDPASRQASGDLVWSTERQEGYMRFSGLTANDPTRWQYQLWIIDRERPDEMPVDGGVFDVRAGMGEVVVSFRPKWPVSDPSTFAVTIEKPGGVEVSKRERLPLLAMVPEHPCDDGL